MREIFSRLEKFEIRMRKAVNSQMNGNFSSIFKGTGLEFSDLRTYQYGDDVRTIDWITTAKGHGAFVKIFKEEKEQTVFFLLDVSASQNIGQDRQMKLDRARETCGVLALSALKEGSHVGLYCFSDQKELYLKPEMGIAFGYKFIWKLFQLQPKSLKTDLAGAIGFAMNMLKRKSVLIFISDFLDENYKQNLKALAKNHDLVVIHLHDPREVHLPKLGLIPILDQETGKTRWVNTSSRLFSNRMKGDFEKRKNALKAICTQYNANYLDVSTEDHLVPRLVELFRTRK